MIIKPVQYSPGSSKNNSSDSKELKITKITKQQKRQDRYSIYIDEKYSFSLSEYQLAGAKLFVGKQFTQEELTDFIDESAFGKAYERALNYVMIRPRSKREIQDYLTRTFLYPKPKIYIDKSGVRQFVKREIDKTKVKNMIERVMARLDEKRYINDEVFARAWVNSRQLTKKSSKRKLEQELRAKSVDSEIIATVLQNQNETEIENLREIINKKRRLPKYQDNVKLTQYLLRQGFDYDDIRDYIDEASETI
jgi:regulatory protein